MECLLGMAHHCLLVCLVLLTVILSLVAHLGGTFCLAEYPFRTKKQKHWALFPFLCIFLGWRGRSQASFPANSVSCRLLSSAYGSSQRPETRECAAGCKHECQDSWFWYVTPAAFQKCDQLYANCWTVSGLTSFKEPSISFHHHYQFLCYCEKLPKLKTLVSSSLSIKPEGGRLHNWMLLHIQKFFKNPGT